MAEAARKINYPYFDTTAANEAEYYQLKPGERKVVPLDEKRRKNPSRDRKKKPGPHRSSTITSSGTDSDRVGYLRDRYGIDVQPDQLSPHNQEKIPRQSKNAVAAYPHITEPTQKSYQKNIQEGRKKIRIRNKSKASSGGVIKKTGTLFTGVMLTSVALTLYILHLKFVMISTVALGALGAAAIGVSWVTRLVPDVVLELAGDLAAGAAAFLNVNLSVFHPLNAFFLAYFLHFLWGILVVGVIVLLALLRRANPIGGEWHNFKVTLVFFIILMHIIPVANFLVIIPLLFWIFLIARTR